MRLLDTAARVALGWVFVQSGVGVLRAPEIPATRAEPVLTAARQLVPKPLPDDLTLVRANAATQVVAGGALALGIAVRPAAAVLIASIIPTTAGGHRFWEYEAGPDRAGQRNHFLKNISIAGGLLHVLITPRRHRTGEDIA